MSGKPSGAVPPRYVAPSDSVDVCLARRLGVGVATAHQYRIGSQNLRDRLIAIIRAYREIGDEAALQAYLAPLLAEIDGVPAEPFTPRLQREAQEADLTEDLLEAQLHEHPTDDVIRSRYRQAIWREVAALTREARALA